MTNERRKEINAKRITTLDPEFQEIVELGIEELENDGWMPYITQALRSMDEQTALFAQGRQSLDEVNALRKKVGWDAIEDVDNRICTRARAGQSRHNYGKAVDLVNVDSDGNLEWESDEFYEAADSVFESHGCRWGGHFSSITDKPHFEID